MIAYSNYLDPRLTWTCVTLRHIPWHHTTYLLASAVNVWTSVDNDWYRVHFKVLARPSTISIGKHWKTTWRARIPRTSSLQRPNLPWTRSCRCSSWLIGDLTRQTSRLGRKNRWEQKTSGLPYTLRERLWPSMYAEITHGLLKTRPLPGRLTWK